MRPQNVAAKCSVVEKAVVKCEPVVVAIEAKKGLVKPEQSRDVQGQGPLKSSYM